MVEWTVTDNILPQVIEQIHIKAGEALEEAGALYRKVAQDECPVSDIDEPGYVHLIETINYEVDTSSLQSQQYVTFFVLKDYAQFVNDGTSRMAPRPFHDTGVNAVSEGFEDIVERTFRSLKLGRLRE
jgi:hypothetical protein